MNAPRVLTALLLTLSLLPVVAALDGTTFLGYTFGTDVTEHSKIDLDQEQMEVELDKGKPDFSAARAIYASGGNSNKTSSRRTLQGFSTEAGTKLAGDGFYELFRKYYGSEDYADKFVTNALDGAGRFKEKKEELLFLSECANKGSQYQNVWMYIIHEMEDAINDCTAGTPTDNDDPAVEAWDEAVAFYTGSTVLDDTTEVGSRGFLIYTLAQKRAVNFGTTDENEISKTNKKIFDLFKRGQKELRERECQKAVETKNLIVRQMTIPVVQGIMRYVVLGKAKEDGKSHGEGWAFLSAVLPLIDNCDSNVANKLIDNFKPELEKPMPDSVEDVSRELQSVYNCLGFTCEEVGRYDNEEGQDETAECSNSGAEYKVIEGTTRPSKQHSSAGGDSDEGLSSGAVAGIVIGLLVALALAVVIVLVLRRRKGMKQNMGFAPQTEIPMDA